jgi:hypothetical protein
MSRGRALAAFGIALAASACAGPRYHDGGLPDEPGRTQTLKSGQARMWCAPYAREHSQVKIFGDAYTWWDQAAGKFRRDSLPDEGAVMVLADYAGPERGHLAVVKKLVSAREIRVDHANWLNDGSIYVNNPVADVSAANDWSAIKVWNMKTGRWGIRIYSVKGFIGPGPVGRERVALTVQNSNLFE